MAELTEEQKTAIVIGLAHFKRPTDVVRMIRDEFEVETSVRQVIGYDPTRPAFEGSDKWRVMFDAYRKAYVTEAQSVPIANQGFRLRKLQEMFEAAERKGNHVLAAQHLEQAAKEIGGILTNVRNVDVTQKQSALADMTPEERRAAAIDIIRASLTSAREEVAKNVVIEQNDKSND